MTGTVEFAARSRVVPAIASQLRLALEHDERRRLLTHEHRGSAVPRCESRIVSGAQIHLPARRQAAGEAVEPRWHPFHWIPSAVESVRCHPAIAETQVVASSVAQDERLCVDHAFERGAGHPLP